MKIIVNGTTHEVESSVLTFEDVIQLADESLFASVTYCRAAGPKSEGCLSQGQSVAVQEGMIINAIVTGNA